MPRERSSTDGGSPFSPLPQAPSTASGDYFRRWSFQNTPSSSQEYDVEWAVARFCNETRTIPRRFLYLRPIRGFISETPEQFLSNVASYGVTESLLRLERWLGVIGATSVLDRVFASLYENELVPVLNYTRDGNRYHLRDDERDVSSIATLYAADCPSNYGMIFLDANQFEDARRIAWAREIQV